MITQYPDKNHPGSQIIFFILALNIIGVLIACTKIESIAKINIGAFLVLQCDSVTVEANLIDLGTGISEYGHCWDIFPFPTTDDSKTIFHNATVGTFRNNLQ
jgi:predicted membrane channel-forming protein YqfA (hemolysin III family)